MIAFCAGKPWSWTSMKKPSLPKMSWNRPAAAKAASRSRICPWLPSSLIESGASSWGTSPPRHPEVAMIPSECWASSSRSILGL